MDLRASFLQRLDSARAGLETLIPRFDPIKFIYPGWRLKELLDHIAGWDEIILTSLQSHLSGNDPERLTLSIDEYNQRSVSLKIALTYEQSLDEFRKIREAIRSLILQASEEELSKPMAFPWGGKGTFSEMIEIFTNHEEEHAADLLRSINQPSI